MQWSEWLHCRPLRSRNTLSWPFKHQAGPPYCGVYHQCTLCQALQHAVSGKICWFTLCVVDSVACGRSQRVPAGHHLWCGAVLMSAKGHEGASFFDWYELMRLSCKLFCVHCCGAQVQQTHRTLAVDKFVWQGSCLSFDHNAIKPPNPV